MVDVVFLGTGDQIPSRSRSHPSILITYGRENILVDCGEGTQRQFRMANLNPGRLTKILITHWHGDHVLGLPGLLSTLALSGYNKPLEIYVPKGVKRKVESFFRVFSFHFEYPLKIIEVSSGKFFEGEDFYLEAEEMSHGVRCLAYNFVVPPYRRVDKKKLAASGLSGPIVGKLVQGENVHVGRKVYKFEEMTYLTDEKKISVVLDTRFNEKIVPFVRRANLLIGEGTYSGEMVKEAEEHGHLTVKQLAQIARDANVERLAVIHISNRYLNEMKKISSEVKEIFENNFLPRDLDKIEV